MAHLLLNTQAFYWQKRVFYFSDLLTTIHFPYLEKIWELPLRFCVSMFTVPLCKHIGLVYVVCMCTLCIHVGHSEEEAVVKMAGDEVWTYRNFYMLRYDAQQSLYMCHS